MAITIQQQPQKYSPAYNPIEFVLTSGNSGAAGFKYVVVLNIAGEDPQTFYLQPAPIGGHGYIDIHRIIENYLSYDFKIDNSAHFFANSKSYKKYSLSFDEITTADQSLPNFPINSGDYYAFNASLSYFENILYDQNDFILNGVTKRFLTNAPLIQRIERDQKFWIYYLRDVIDVADNMFIEYYDISGALVTTNYFNIFPVIPISEHFIRFNLLPGDFPAPYYKIVTYTKNAALDTITNEKRTFIIDDRCKNHEVIKIHFLNKLGGFDFFNFIRASKNSLSIDRGGYKSIPGTITAGGSIHSEKDRGNVDTNVNYSERVSVNSDWINEEESKWLQELITSPVIFQEKDNKLFAINTQTLNYEFKKTKTDRIFNLKFEFEYSITNSRQRA